MDRNDKNFIENLVAHLAKFMGVDLTVAATPVPIVLELMSRLDYLTHIQLTMLLADHGFVEGGFSDGCSSELPSDARQLCSVCL